jgi:DNA-binding PadR family transcriptional regulator
MESILDNLVQELKRGTLVLGVLLSTGEPVYGYTLVGELQARGMDIEQNTLYPLLRRLEKQGLLSSSWDTAESRPRKYYQLTTLGREVRTRLGQEWQAVNAAISKMEELA